jgi:hypothetical protein
LFVFYDDRNVMEIQLVRRSHEVHPCPGELRGSYDCAFLFTFPLCWTAVPFLETRTFFGLSCELFLKSLSWRHSVWCEIKRQGQNCKLCLEHNGWPGVAYGTCTDFGIRYNGDSRHSGVSHSLKRRRDLEHWKRPSRCLSN